MKGKNHQIIGFYILIILTVFIILLTNYSFRDIEGFALWFIIVTYFIGPDSDTQSLSSVNIGIFKYIFLPLKHRGVSHSPLLWIGVFSIFWYHGYEPEGLGGLVASVLHIVMDRMSDIKNIPKKFKRWVLAKLGFRHRKKQRRYKEIQTSNN
jgi:uncharacterized metal-binding protein